MNKNITGLRIVNLFNKHSVYIDLTKNTLVFIGANGIGKSTILKIVDNFARQNFADTVFVPFDRIEVFINGEEGENKATIDYLDFFPEPDYVIDQYINYLRQKELDIPLAEKMCAEEDPNNYEHYEERKNIFQRCICLLLEKGLYGTFLYNLFAKTPQPKNISNYLTKANLNIDDLNAANLCSIEGDYEDFGRRIFIGSPLIKFYRDNAYINAGTGIFFEFDYHSFYFDLVQTYLLSGNIVEKSGYIDNEIEWVFSSKIADKELIRRVDEKEFSDAVLADEEWSQFLQDNFVDIPFNSSRVDSRYNFIDEDYLNIANDVKNKKLIDVHKVINRHYYKMEVIKRVNNAISRYAKRCYLEIEKYEGLDNHDSEIFDELKKGLKEVKEKFTEEIRIDYKLYIKPILVHKSFFDVDIDEVIPESEQIIHPNIQNELARIELTYNYELLCQFVFYKALLDYILEVLPILKDSNSRTEKIVLFEKKLCKYMADKYLTITPAGLLIKDSYLYKNENHYIRIFDEEDIDLSVISSGEKKIIILFTIAIFGTWNTILLDEPELSLSLVWQESLLPDLIEVKGDKKLLVSTHSPYIVQDESLRSSIVYLPQKRG